MPIINNNFKKYIIYLLIFTIIFALDRITKIYILHLAEINNTLDIYITSFLNFYLIWNKGIAFGLLSFDKNIVYNFITFFIAFVTLIILIIALKSSDFKGYLFMIIFSGSIGNLFDRLYFSAVPDFIDFHINDFHWFIFNVADIFISLGVICLIFVEIFINKEVNDKK
jgi:signal peptidase II|tara:strand:- start:648 stop:1151 length:504 start_codon:yes stop_codon:yes gene_type:complete